MKKWVKATAIVLALMGLSMKNAYAIDTTTVNEKWGKPTVVYGGGLTEAQIKQTSELLGIKDSNTVLTETATGQDLIKYLGSGDGNTSVMISSVMVQKTDKGTGVKVKIKTPENITLVTAEQYANAAITAGVTDAEIEVAAVSKVTGESALTGVYKAFEANVYKAFEANGVQLDAKRTEVAQQELEVTNKIAQENANAKGFDSSKLDKAMIEIKKELAELKQKQGQLATKEDIERIINDALKNNSLQNVISQDQIKALVAFAQNYQNTSAIDSKQVLEQLNSLSKSVSEKINSLVEQAKNEGWLDKIAQFFQSIFDAIKNLFSQN